MKTENLRKPVTGFLLRLTRKTMPNKDFHDYATQYGKTSQWSLITIICSSNFISPGKRNAECSAVAWIKSLRPVMGAMTFPEGQEDGRGPMPSARSKKNGHIEPSSL